MLTLSVHSMNTSPPSNLSIVPCVLSTSFSASVPPRFSSAQYDALGSGLVLSPERCRGLPSKRLQGRVSLLDTRNAAKRLTCGGVLPKLERVGWALPQDGGPQLLVECVRGVEEPEPEAEPAGEATTTTTTLDSGSGSGETGADSSPTPFEETRVEAPALGGFNGVRVQPRPVAHRRLGRTTYAVAIRREYTAPSHTRSHPIPSRATTPVPVPLKKPKKMSPPPRKRKLTDEWTLSMHWPIGHACPPTEIEQVFPVGEVVTEVYG